MAEPQNKTELIAAVEREWGKLMAVAEALTDEQMQTPDGGGWSPKDNLAHLTEWMIILMGYHMDQRPAHRVLGVPAAVTRAWNPDTINAALYERNRERSRRAVMSRLKRTYNRLLTRLKATPFRVWLKPRRPDDPKRRPLLGWVLGDTTHHFREHRRAIEKAVRAGL